MEYLENVTPEDFQRAPAVGDKVNYHAIIGGPVTSAGHIVQQVDRLSCGELVAFISGKSGCVSVDALSPEVEQQEEGQE